MKDEILECDFGCLYTSVSAAKLPSTKRNGIPRCIKHGDVLRPATWAYGCTITEARHQRNTERKARQVSNG